MNEYCIISGSANPAFSENIAKHLGKKLIDSSSSTFADGEIQIKINENLRRKEVYIIQPTCTTEKSSVNDSLIELILMIDAVKRGSAEKVNVVIPYYGYGRQDRKAAPREPISAEVIARLIEKAGADRIIAFDLHAGAIEGFFQIPVTHLSSRPIAAKYFNDNFKAKEEYVVVSPDEGGVKRASKLAEKLGYPLAFLHKARPGKNESIVVAVVGDVKGKTALLYDDMVDTGGTHCNAAEALKKNGAKQVHAFCTHGVLSGSAQERIENSQIDSMAVTDTIPPRNHAKKIKTISVAQLFAEAIKRTHDGESVSELFK